MRFSSALTSRGRKLVTGLVVFGLWALVACAPERVPPQYRPTDAHDAYRHSLEQAQLLQTALGADWVQASELALRSPTRIQTPFEEHHFIEADKAVARGFRFEVTRGQKVEILVEAQSDKPLRLFIDLYRLDPTSDDPLTHVASAGEGDRRLDFEPRDSGEYVLRVQPELLRRAECQIAIRRVRALAFPVDGYDTPAIGSGFGAPRDAGRRLHHGVDIFARRHTPVLATSDAIVRRVDVWSLGGNVVWLWDAERQLRLYYAHLQTQEVTEGQRVSRGDLIGTVGNTGNARTTPPHLHFGVYLSRRGPVNPLPFIYQPNQRAPRHRASTELVGKWGRTSRDDTTCFNDPAQEVPLRRLGLHTPVFFRSAAGSQLLVRLPDGMEGFVSFGNVELLDEPLEKRQITRARPLRVHPGPGAPVVRRLQQGSQVEVLGRSDNVDYVRDTNGAIGWIQEY